jgi:MFS family permease
MVLITGCLCVFVWLFNTSLAMLILFACLFGFSTGKFAALIPSAIGQVTPDEKLGARMGSFYSVVAIASLVGTPISSALITDNNERDGYSRLICFAVSMVLEVADVRARTDSDTGRCAHRGFHVHLRKPSAVRHGPEEALVRRAGKAAGQGSSGGDGDEVEREEVVVLLESKREYVKDVLGTGTQPRAGPRQSRKRMRLFILL